MSDRMRVLLLSALLALLTLGTASAAMAATVDGGLTTITAPGDYSFTLAHGGLTRAYLVHVPRGYQPASPTPLLVAFHGGRRQYALSGR